MSVPGRAGCDPYRVGVTAAAETVPATDAALVGTSPAVTVAPARSTGEQLVSPARPTLARAGQLASSLAQLPAVRAIRRQSLTAPGGVVLAALLLAPGLLLDLLRGATPGLPTAVCFVVAASGCALAVRPAALGTAAVLPPVLFTAGVATLAWAGGANASTRHLVLDVGTTLALSAPVLFAGTMAAIALALGRGAWMLLRR